MSIGIRMRQNSYRLQGQVIPKVYCLYEIWGILLCNLLVMRFLTTNNQPLTPQGNEVYFSTHSRCWISLWPHRPSNFFLGGLETLSAFYGLIWGDG